MHCPRFRSHLRIEINEPDRVTFRHETGQRHLHGRLPCLLAPLINGRNSVMDITDRLEGVLTPLDVRYGLSLLEKEGVLIESSQGETAPYPLFRDLLGIGSEDYRQRLEQTRVSIISRSVVGTERLSSKLEELKVRVVPDGEIQVVLVDDYLDPELDELNRDALAQHRPWLLVRPAGSIAWIGPLFTGRGPACWSCLAERLRQGRWGGARAEQAEEASAPIPLPMLPSTIDTALSLTATMIFRWVVQQELVELDNRMLTCDMMTLANRVHTLLPLPCCHRCGAEPQKRDPKPLALSSHRKLSHTDGGYRVATPEETWRAVRHHISPLIGIVSDLRPYQPNQSDGLLNVWVAGRNLAHRPASRRRGLRSMSAGKGQTEQQARLGAVCEALERFSGLHQGDENTRTASYSSLGEEAIHPNQCLLFSDRQYQDREEWNRQEAAFNWVPLRFDEEHELEWSPVWSLRDQRYRYLPAGYCYFAYPYAPEEQFYRADSNGNAAGMTTEEAILQGFFELVERDAVAAWWYNQVRRPGVQLRSFDEPYFWSLQEYYAQLECPCHVLDLTSDLAIPTFAAISGRPGEDDLPLALGFGAHFDPAIAISRALTEMNQMHVGLHSGKAEDLYTGCLESTFLIPDERAALRESADFEQWQSNDLKEDVERCVTIAAEHDLDTLVLDQSRSGVGLSVVKVIVPGLRQFWARFAPGRLYDIPVTMGWRRQRLTEPELNPSHLTL
jgi:ribosomal protein S12 methylthiotransferase accessory factor